MPQEPLHIFCESANVGSNKGQFALILQSGNVPSVFIFSPDHMKQLSKLIALRVSEWETVNGVLEGRLQSEPLKSPYDFGTLE